MELRFFDSLQDSGKGSGRGKIIPLHKDKKSHVLAFAPCFLNVSPGEQSPGGLLMCLLTFGENYNGLPSNMKGIKTGSLIK